jgi:hypothetical protein
MRASERLQRRHSWRYGTIAALAACLALALGSAPQPASAAQRAPAGAQPQTSQSGQSWVNCGGRPRVPTLGYIQPGHETYVTIVSQAADWVSDLELDDGRGHKTVLWLDASHNGLGETQALPEVMTPSSDGKEFTLDIYVHNSQKLYTSTSANAIATYGDSASDWYVCFEDGGDSDWDDEVVHVVRPDFEPGLTALTPHPANGFEVDVRYNDLQLVSLENKDYSTLNEAIARAVESRALQTLQEYNDLLSNAGQPDAVPHRVEIWLERHPYFYGSSVLGTPARAWTQCTASVPVTKFRADAILDKGEVQAYVKSPSGPLTLNPGEWIATTIDHELWHTVQCNRLGWQSMTRRYLLGREFSATEGTATAAQDLIADTDDRGIDGDGTFLETVTNFLKGDVTIDSYDRQGNLHYNTYAAGVLYEYLAEHYADPGSQLTLEEKLADFLIQLTTGSETHLTNVADAMGNNKKPDDVLDALRDFYVSAYVQDAANVRSLPDRFRIFDETTYHGQAPSHDWTAPGLSRGPLVPIPTGPNQSVIPPDTDYTLVADPRDLSRSLVDDSGALWEIDVPSGATFLQIQMTDQPEARTAPLIAAVPVDASRDVVVDPSHLFWVGPADGATQTYLIPVSGMSKVGLIVVSGKTIAEIP